MFYVLCSRFQVKDIKDKLQLSFEHRTGNREHRTASKKGLPPGGAGGFLKTHKGGVMYREDGSLEPELQFIL